ncbi:hypothetical protein MUK42_33156 [Musa troglodytarum]|uniref:Uncharacterized protein n=1 Tax=Musa troglodytarum TaxID=320322 RepID=A0A9E7L7T6_9LILI|nr:hypothetical protein MUK42_33156 [Musa troglodytarum]
MVGAGRQAVVLDGGASRAIKSNLARAQTHIHPRKRSPLWKLPSLATSEERDTGSRRYIGGEGGRGKVASLSQPPTVYHRPRSPSNSIPCRCSSFLTAGTEIRPVSMPWASMAADLYLKRVRLVVFFRVIVCQAEYFRQLLKPVT